MTALNIVARGLHVAALLSLFGTLIFIATMAEARDAAHLRFLLRRLVRISVACALLAGLAWLTTQSALIADTGSISATVHVMPVVALQTQYGRWFGLRCVGLIVLLFLPLSRRIGLCAGLALAGAALAVQPLLGHAGAIGGGVGVTLIASEILHLLAAGAWLGGLLPLLLAIGILPPDSAVRTCRSFTPIGLSAVMLLAGTAVLQIVTLVGGLPGLFGTAYGHAALMKLGLFIVLLLLAALNRLVLTERMAQDGPPTQMRVSIAIEMMAGALVILIAGFLASLTPGTHVQPVWPFPWRPSLAAFDEPLLRRELTRALAAVAVGVVLGIIGIVWRRIRWAALAAGLFVLVLAIPHFDLLFVQAYPTSFFASPTEFAATAIAHGARLFAANCATCHGEDARGSGPAAGSLPVPPSDLTAEHFWAHSDGDLYWFVSQGFAAPNGGIAMPGFKGILSTAAIWDLIDYLHAHNAGESLHRTGKWEHPLPAPQFDAECPGRRAVDLDDLRGHVLHVIAESGDERAEAATPTDTAVTTIIAVRRPPVPSSPFACVTREPDAWTAFAIVLGMTPDTLAGAQFLVDRDGWLRIAWRPGEPGDWTNPRRLAAAIRNITSHPLATPAQGGHSHHH